MMLTLKKEVTLDRSDFINFLRDETQNHWNTFSKPLYIADIPSLLRERKSVDYKTILGEQRLKGFAEDTAGSSSYLVVKHQFQKAKVGLIPPGESFDFPDDRPFVRPALCDSDRIEMPAFKTQKATLEFLRAIASLTPEEQASIVIPVPVIAKLLNEK